MQGSNPWARCIGLIVLFVLILLRLTSLYLPVLMSSEKGGKAMGSSKLLAKLIGCSVLETLWAIGASCVGGVVTLPT